MVAACSAPFTCGGPSGQCLDITCGRLNWGLHRQDVLRSFYPPFPGFLASGTYKTQRPSSVSVPGPSCALPGLYSHCLTCGPAVTRPWPVPLREWSLCGPLWLDTHVLNAITQAQTEAIYEN